MFFWPLPVVLLVVRSRFSASSPPRRLLSWGKRGGREGGGGDGFVHPGQVCVVSRRWSLGFKIAMNSRPEKVRERVCVCGASANPFLRLTLSRP